MVIDQIEARMGTQGNQTNLEEKANSSKVKKVFNKVVDTLISMSHSTMKEKMKMKLSLISMWIDQKLLSLNQRRKA